MAGANERVVDNGDGTETVYVTKYRTEFRAKQYDAVEMNSSKSLDGELKAALDGRQFQTKIAGKYKMQEDRHSVNFPDIGLTPTSPRFVTDAEWMKTMSDAWIQRLGSELQEHWIKRFCLEPQDAKISVREQVFRCAYQVDANSPPVVSQYFMRTWGVSFDDWRQARGAPSAPAPELSVRAPASEEARNSDGR